MEDQKLAIFGGPKAIQSEFKRYNPIGAEEVRAATGVIESGVLSQFLGAWHEDFFGGPKVKEFERCCEDYFGVKHAVTVNSWTSGLIAAVGAIAIEPGDEVIVPAYTYSATANVIIHCGATPVFVDVCEDFNICPIEVLKAITPRTKVITAESAIVVVVSADGITTLAPSSTGSLKNIKTITRM